MQESSWKRVVSEYAKTLSGFTNVIPTQIEREDGAALTELFQSFYSSEKRWPANTDELTAFANLHAPDSALVQRNIEIQITPESNGDVTVSFRSTRGLRRKMRLSPKSTE